jgi:methylglutaconyl-CoA hydratase
MYNIDEYKTIILSHNDKVVTITLNRPQVHNAFNIEMIKELFDIFSRLKSDQGVRCIVLTGAGKSFCAGADLNWMRDVVNYTYQDNYNEALLLAKLCYLMYTHPKCIIGKINGSAIGGGVGFLSVCDIAIANETAVFGLSEVKLGLIPAVISPYVIKRIGESKAKEYFITGERISAEEAKSIGLINYILPEEKLDKVVDEKVKKILSSGPNAISKVKELFSNIITMKYDEILAYTANSIAELRLSQEAQEGMRAFLEKRNPKWIDENNL